MKGAMTIFVRTPGPSPVKTRLAAGLLAMTLHAPVFQERLFAQTMVLQHELRDYRGVTESSNGMALRFDISVLPKDAIVHSARLEIFPSFEPMEERTDFKVMILKEPLDSQGQSGRADSLAMLSIHPGTRTWVSLDLASTLRAWRETSATNHGLAFKPSTEAAKVPWVVSSSEDKAHRPRLFVDYAMAGFGPLSISRQDAARICMCMNGRLTIQRSGAFSPVSWVISSLEGKRIQPPLAGATAEKAHLDMRGYPKGLYHVALRNKAGQTLHTRVLVD